ncbi:hypothetical protein D9757_008571 [Collybiopsis confluens]|uniref:Uncharacterized protein n=1 Tax=Collybiopsis confluens TaxID=2823264 RepID=A0A8H5M9I7_9AGAR|nr:hypothetical protein D9757_008571 [Collybiopsis confluens]
MHHGVFGTIFRRAGLPPSRFKLALFTAALATLVAASPAPRGYGAPSTGNTCSTGSVQCCNTFTKASDPAASKILCGLADVVVQDLNVGVGLTCSPVLGVGSGGCSAQSVCCEDNSHGGRTLLRPKYGGLSKSLVPRSLRNAGLARFPQQQQRFTFGISLKADTMIAMRMLNQHRSALPPRPPIPPARSPNSGPLPWLTLSQVNKYLKPLRFYMPWTFTTSNIISTKTQGPGWSYHGKYLFKTWEEGTLFASRVRDIVHSEGIQYSLANSRYFYMELEQKTPADLLRPGFRRRTTEEEEQEEQEQDKTTIFLLRIKTANAFLPQQIIDLRQSTPAREDTRLTLRDVRFAMLVDDVFQLEFLERGLGIPSVSAGSEDEVSSPSPSASQPISQSHSDEPRTPQKRPNRNLLSTPPELLVSNMLQKGFCPCCALPHSLEECSKRHEDRYKPGRRMKCDICKMPGHWVVDCRFKSEEEARRVLRDEKMARIAKGRMMGMGVKSGSGGYGMRRNSSDAVVGGVVDINDPDRERKMLRNRQTREKYEKRRIERHAQRSGTNGI